MPLHSPKKETIVQIEPVKRQLLQVVEVASDVLERRVGDSRAPGDVQRPKLPQVLGDQLDAVVRDLGTAGQRQHCQVRQRVNWNLKKSFDDAWANQITDIWQSSIAGPAILECNKINEQKLHVITI